MEKNSLRYLWSYVRIFKYFFLLIIFLTLLSQICGQFYPYFLAKIYDTAAKASQDADVWERIFAYALDVYKRQGFHHFLGLISRGFDMDCRTFCGCQHHQPHN